MAFGSGQALMEAVMCSVDPGVGLSGSNGAPSFPAGRGAGMPTVDPSDPLNSRPSAADSSVTPPGRIPGVRNPGNDLVKPGPNSLAAPGPLTCGRQCLRQFPVRTDLSGGDARGRSVLPAAGSGLTTRPPVSAPGGPAPPGRRRGARRRPRRGRYAAAAHRPRPASRRPTVR